MQGGEKNREKSRIGPTEEATNSPIFVPPTQNSELVNNLKTIESEAKAGIRFRISSRNNVLRVWYLSRNCYTFDTILYV